LIQAFQSLFLVIAAVAPIAGPANYSTGNPALDFFYTLFNGIAEVPLFSSPITGILIVAGVFLASRKAGAMMVLSGLIGAGMAIALGAPYGLVTFGLFGYNSILTGMAFWSGPFVKANKATFWLSVFGAAVTAVVWMAFAHLMGDLFILDGLKHSWAIPGFTSSFIFTTWAMMYAAKRYGHDIWPAPPPPAKEELIAGSGNPAPTDGFKWTAKEFIIATLKGVSQVTFVENWKTGVFWVVGLTLAFELAPMITTGTTTQVRPWFTNGYTAQWNPLSPLYFGGLMALVGSGIGAALAILTKLPTVEVRIGLHGFNQVLVMIALTSFVPLTPQTFLMAVLATVSCSVVVMPALQRFFGMWGLPALTGPFVFTAWVWLLGISGFSHIPAGIGWSRPNP
jgi:urea transporter